MKISEIWLREWVDPNMDAQKLAELLTMAGLEVDAVNPVAGPFTNVVVAQVVTCKPHPQADKLSLCEVTTGTEQLFKIVCGASNVRQGLKVALAQLGAKLPNGLVIKEAKLRGELSQGMLCSASELGLSDTSEGILELDDDAPLGQDISEYLLLNDQVFDIDLTPNRPDCLSLRGIAREVATLTNTALQSPIIDAIKPVIDDQVSIKISVPEACPSYCGRIIKGLNPQATTPLWMRERLRRAGIRSINPIVDVTNYVMLEWGQPMHAFDLHKIKAEITVRSSHVNERMELLNAQEISLPEKSLLITSDDRPIALAGVMGGADSAVDEQTVDIFLESAYFNPITIAGVARQFGLVTDSSQRFERGVDPALQVSALERATALLVEIAAGKPGPLCTAIDPMHLPVRAKIAFNPSKVVQLTGITIPEKTMLQFLEHLGMEVKQQADHWDVIPPSYRFDIELEVDLIEEIIRLYGYDNIPGQPMIASIQAGTINPTEQLQTKLSAFFTSRNYHETISYSFIDPQLQQVIYPHASVLKLLNPISSELSQMRTGMWPGLIASMMYNIHRQQTAIKFFECGVVFDVENGQIQEHPCIAGLIMGETGALNWAETTRKFDFYDLKGDLQALFEYLHINNIAFEPTQQPALHPGKSAQIIHAGEIIGWCGVLHPRIAADLDLPCEAILFEMRLKHLLSSKTLRYKTISKYPQIRRDLSLLADDNVPAAAIAALIEDTVPQGWLKSFEVFDVYTGNTIPQGKKSLAVAITLQDTNRTLVDEEINQVISAIIKTLADKLAIALRD